jgi:hypothetical protein
VENEKPSSCSALLIPDAIHRRALSIRELSPNSRSLSRETSKPKRLPVPTNGEDSTRGKVLSPANAVHCRSHSHAFSWNTPDTLE